MRSEADKLLDEAYALEVVDKKTDDAIVLLRRSLEIDPDHYRSRAFLGMILADRADPESKREARAQFIEAIERTRDPSIYCTAWPEEAAIHHLGVWEWGQESPGNAALFFLIDYIYCDNERSRKNLEEILRDTAPSLLHVITLLLGRLKSSYKVILRDQSARPDSS